MSVEERRVNVTVCDACTKELTNDYVHVVNAKFENVFNNEVVSTLELEDKHFCNRVCLKNFIEAYV